MKTGAELLEIIHKSLSPRIDHLRPHPTSSTKNIPITPGRSNLAAMDDVESIPIKATLPQPV
ncbi:hypothetical protein PCANC_13346 [Puccinia coronata f. sp. avenae]|uniref:Uncharacterized protein n=1 Tax=Puccinia coronata f. sp. avenae TaxID=200324 RepID=A0A2N5STV3_9BASI|nr:hypothetical protein PCANC_13346 [Puccinia coronata f. sp. avenae]